MKQFWQAHPATSKPEKKALCRMIDCRKLSPEAALHAAHNERLPVRAVIQVLFSQQAKVVSPHLDWSGSIGSGGRIPGLGHDLATRSLSKREVTEKLAQQAEVRRLREEVARLHSLCHSLQAQMEKQQPEKRKSFFRWRKMGTSSVRLGSNYGERVDGCGPETPITVKVKPSATKATGRWRSSLS